MTPEPEQLAEHLRALNEVGVVVTVEEDTEVWVLFCSEPEFRANIDGDGVEDGWIWVSPQHAGKAIRIAAEDVVREEHARDVALGPPVKQRRFEIQDVWGNILFADDPLAAAVEAAVRLRRKP